MSTSPTPEGRQKPPLWVVGQGSCLQEDTARGHPPHPMPLSPPDLHSMLPLLHRVPAVSQPPLPWGDHLAQPAPQPPLPPGPHSPDATLGPGQPFFRASPRTPDARQSPPPGGHWAVDVPATVRPAGRAPGAAPVESASFATPSLPSHCLRPCAAHTAARPPPPGPVPAPLPGPGAPPSADPVPHAALPSPMHCAPQTRPGVTVVDSDSYPAVLRGLGPSPSAVVDSFHGLYAHHGPPPPATAAQGSAGTLGCVRSGGAEEADLSPLSANGAPGPGQWQGGTEVQRYGSGHGPQTRRGVPAWAGWVATGGVRSEDGAGAEARVTAHPAPLQAPSGAALSQFPPQHLADLSQPSYPSPPPPDAGTAFDDLLACFESTCDCPGGRTDVPCGVDRMLTAVPVEAPDPSFSATVGRPARDGNCPSDAEGSAAESHANVVGGNVPPLLQCSEFR